MQKIDYTQSIKSTQQLLAFFKKKQKIVDKVNEAAINYIPTIDQWVDNPNYFLANNFKDIETFASKELREKQKLKGAFFNLEICRAIIGYYTVEINEEYFFLSDTSGYITSLSDLNSEKDSEKHRVRVIDQKLKDTKWLLERVVSDAYTSCKNKPKVFFQIKGYCEDEVLTCCSNFKPKLQNIIYDQNLLLDNYLYVKNPRKKSKK